MAAHGIEIAPRRGIAWRVLGELAEVAGIDEERELGTGPVCDLEQRLAWLDQAALRRAVTFAEEQLVIE